MEYCIAILLCFERIADEDVFIVKIDNLLSRHFKLFCEGLHRVIGNDALPKPHLVLFEASFIGDIEDN